MDGLLMKYFVLKPHGDDIYAEASRCVMREYASIIRPVNPQFADDLAEWIERESE